MFKSIRDNYFYIVILSKLSALIKLLKLLTKFFNDDSSPILV